MAFSNHYVLEEGDPSRDPYPFMIPEPGKSSLSLDRATETSTRNQLRNPR